MLIIAILNSVKSHFERAHLRSELKNLNDHSLKDIGFYRDRGAIYPIAGKKLSNISEKESVPEKVIHHNDGG